MAGNHKCPCKPGSKMRGGLVGWRVKMGGVAFSEGSAAGQQDLFLSQSSPEVPDLPFREEMEI